MVQSKLRCQQTSWNWSYIRQRSGPKMWVKMSQNYNGLLLKWFHKLLNQGVYLVFSMTVSSSFLSLSDHCAEFTVNLWTFSFSSFLFSHKPLIVLLDILKQTFLSGQKQWEQGGRFCMNAFTYDQQHDSRLILQVSVLFPSSVFLPWQDCLRWACREQILLGLFRHAAS